jgi:hypothetical protein
MAAPAPVVLNDPSNQAKFKEYTDKLETVKGAVAQITDDASFATNFKKLPLIVDYQPRVGGKSRHKNKNNKKNNKSRRRNQSKRQRK